MTNQRAIVLLSQMYIPAFDDEEKDAITKVIEALTAQEPRVMTREEALNSLVIEYRDGKLREVGKHVFMEGYESYGSIWRVWDRMPTDEQREATPWNAQK